MAQAGGLEILGRQGPRRGHGPGGIVGIITAAQQLGRDRAIEPAAVEIAQSEMIGEAAREGALAGRRRTVYGDDRDVRQYSRRDR